MLKLITYGTEAICALGVRQRITKDGLLEEFLDVFSGVGCLPGEYMTSN